MADTFFALLIFAAVIGLGLVSLILAMASRKTRAAGLTLLVVLGVVVALGISSAIFLKKMELDRSYEYSGHGREAGIPVPVHDVLVDRGAIGIDSSAEQLRVTFDHESADYNPADDDRVPVTIDESRADEPVVESEPAKELDLAAADDSDEADPVTTLLVRSDPNRPNMAELERYLDESEWAPPESATSTSGSSLSDEIVPPARPLWVGVPAFTITKKERTDYVPVASGPFATRGECRRALAEAMQIAVEEYVADHRDQEDVAHVLAFNSGYIKDHLQRGGVYEETVHASFGPMLQQHSLLEFGREFRDDIDRRWQHVKVTSRLAHVALVAIAILAGLATVFFYLRLDTATKGYYSGRLQFATGTVILGLVVLGILVARWIPWF